MTSTGKADQVQSMFNRLAPSYDRMNRIIAMGQDNRWRREVIRLANIPPNGRVLDLAAGTGDIALAVKAKLPKAEVIAGDFSLGMLEAGRQRKGAEELSWVACDAMKLPFTDNSFDAVCFAFLLRNVEDIGQTLAEIYRVLKPGGRAVCLDTSPPSGPFSFFTRTYLQYGFPLLGRLIAKDREAYTYLCKSTLAFRTPAELIKDFESAGFDQVACRGLMLGTIAIHSGTKPGTKATN